MEKIIKKYWKLVLLATIIIFLLIPFDIIINKGAILQTQEEYMQLAEGENANQIAEFTDAYLNSAVQSKLYSPLNIAILLILPVLLSSQLFKHIRGQRITKRLFIGQAIFVIVPYIINAIILVVIKFLGGLGDYLSLWEITRWLGASILVALMISAISNFVGCFTKARTTHILSVYGLLFIPVLIAFTIDKLLQVIVHGFVGYSTAFSNILVEWPGLKVFSLFSYNYTQNMYLGNFGILHVIVYIAIIVLLLFGTIKILNKQKKYNIISIITIYSVVFLLTMLFIGSISMMTNIMMSTVISLVIAGVIYAICIIFLKEKNIKKLAISYIIYSVIILLLVFIVQNNIFGYETKMPNIDDVDYAIFSTNNPLTTKENIVYKEKDNIQYIIDKQKELVDKQTTIKDVSKKYYRYYIQYSLKNGDKITRAYDLEPTYEAIYDSNEFVSQRYNYILNEEANSKLTKINVLGIYNDIVFEIQLKQGEELFDEITKAVSNDIKNNKAYKATENEYGIYGEKDGLQYLTIDVSINSSTAESYVAYATINPKYELVKKVQKYIDEESDLITWESTK